MARTAVLGLPRIGADRELKTALEAHWAGTITSDELQEVARSLRAANLQRVAGAGVDVAPVGDFAFYDLMLDTAELVGLVAERHGGAEASGLPAHFLACRGAAGITPLEMTKWFDTNYHFLVPELEDGQQPRLRADKWLSHLREAQAAGVTARPAVIGPLTLLLLSKGDDAPLNRLAELVEVYRDLLAAFADAGAPEVQIDEPILVTGLSDDVLRAFSRAYARLLDGKPLEVTLATYFDRLDESTLAVIGSLPIDELHVDLVRAPGQLGPVLAALPSNARLSAGVIDGRNVWATDLDAALDELDKIVRAIGADRLTIAPSCSLLHVPYSAAREQGLDDELRSWLAFGEEKLAELTLLARAIEATPAQRDELLVEARTRASERRTSPRTNDIAVRGRVGRLQLTDYDRTTPIEARLREQAERLQLPPLPTTTIGSFPQTGDIRSARREHRAGTLSDEGYEQFLRGEIAHVVREQEDLGLDVLVHGEPERNDMVEYFGEQLDGFAFSQWGWVQSYGSRCVKPPILFGDVSRPAAMTVAWWQYAQSLTAKPMKGMLTGPVTILQWSFVRDDQPRRETCTQIALAIQDEVVDLERAGAAIIQIDEAALREGLPLRAEDQDAYVAWAIDCFRLTAAPARPETQVHTHMCYSEFAEMIEHIARLDADVISLEASRSGMELLEVFRDFDYPGQIGPGVYDIHSPRVPTTDEVESLLALAETRLDRDQLWSNPDCGLKTRGWPETREALRHLVEATARRRQAKVAIPA
ncbi:MAG: 5-methyltetrahydropteroyltriglutamate--homocysteine S-methyltransferase [Solirubrobacteraceae bacterium]